MTNRSSSRPSAPQAATSKVAAAEPALDEVELAAENAPAIPEPSPYPIRYYNPKITDERFFIMGNAHPVRFVNGSYLVRDETEEASVRAALRVHGPHAADRWKGEDANGTVEPRRKQWVDRKTGFATYNPLAQEDFEFFHQD